MNKKYVSYLFVATALFFTSTPFVYAATESSVNLPKKDTTVFTESSEIETTSTFSSTEETTTESSVDSSKDKTSVSTTTEKQVSEEEIIDLNAGQKVTDYEQKVYRKDWDIWNKPYENGAKSLGISTPYYQNIVVVTREAQKGNSTYVLISSKSADQITPIGWINKSGLGNLELGQKVTPYEQRVYKKNWDIWDQPYVSGAESIANSSTYYEKNVTVTRESVSNGTKYVLIETKNGVIGWINKNAVDAVDPLYTKEGALVPNTYKFITKDDWSIWNEPYQSGSKVVKNTTEYLNEKVLITRRAKNSSGTYVKIWVYRDGGYQYKGWLNESGLSNNIPEINQMSGELIPNTYGEILKSNWDIWERPYKPGTKAVANTSNYRNQTLLFTRKAKTNYGTYYKMWAKKNGGYQYVGWIKDSGTTLLDKVEYKKSVSIPMKQVAKWNWTLWDRPYVYGAKPKSNSSTYYGQNVQIASEAKTNYGVYYELKSYGKNIGWMKKEGLNNLGNEVIVPLIQANQISSAGYAPSGCAACSAYTALHSKNKAMDKNLVWFYNNLPQHPTNPDIGQIGNPWTYLDFRAVISPIGLNNFMRSLGGDTQNITGQSMSYVKRELSLGNPVLFWGRVGLSDGTNSLTTHVMTFAGYKDGYYLVQDPAYDNGNHRRWFSEQRVNDYMAVKGRKMVVIR
ncbi:GW dipeptide domain-containing protein [Vagococcus hydrophili]|uniref:GW domain-containing protein n=1 Tax=Vagococcus hydrophili TaxID=2714947 RepID=A0A6G8AR25_9ENTE|nr:GW dipeptide domain-containing protein [Vagococcus hydrophili]QIL47392.1 hypothetical protein G7082_02015 [Vagococcus hydrophili]